jgi:hypothetical protein
MRQIIRFAAATILGIASFASSAPLFAQQGYVHEVSGTVTGQVGSEKPSRVDKGMAIPANSTISTAPQSYAVLKFEDGTVVLLKESTSFQVQSYTYQPKASENSNAAFNLLRGGMRMITGLITSRNREALRVATPHATIGIRGTDFAAELTNPLYVWVEEGIVSLANKGGTLLVTAGQYASVASATQVGSIISAAQIPASALQFPPVTLPPATPVVVPGAVAVGGGAATAGGMGIGTTAAIAGAAIAAGIAVSSSGGSNGTTTQH